MYQPILPLGFSGPSPVPLIEQKGVVYTKPWVVELLLDLAGYTARANLVDALAVEPAAGDGAFLVRMAERLIASCANLGRPFSECESSLIAYEIDEASAAVARSAVVKALATAGVLKATAEKLASSWVQVGDYLFDSARLPRADFVIGNPPYIRLEDIPPETAGLYRKAYPTMRGRADVYVAFFEAGLRQLKDRGVCAYICADRWMLNQYGAELRRLVTEGFGVETVVEMHDANPFDDDVSAYPAITVIRRGPQGRAVVASADQNVESASGDILASALKSAAHDGRRRVLVYRGRSMAMQFPGPPGVAAASRGSVRAPRIGGHGDKSRDRGSNRPGQGLHHERPETRRGVQALAAGDGR